VIGGDDFYAGGTAERWDQRSPAEKADQVIDWEARWSAAEDHYFGVIMSSHRFDHVL
jgi:hypothetical protein